MKFQKNIEKINEKFWRNLKDIRISKILLFCANLLLPRYINTPEYKWNSMLPWPKAGQKVVPIRRVHLKNILKIKYPQSYFSISSNFLNILSKSLKELLKILIKLLPLPASHSISLSSLSINLSVSQSTWLLSCLSVCPRAWYLD